MSVAKNHVFGMYRDTSLNGATRRKELEQKRAVIEERRLEEAERRLREKEREEQEANALALKMKLRQLDRQQRHMEMEMRRDAATMVQQTWRAWREYKQDCIAHLVLNAVVSIQRVARIWLSRRELYFRILLLHTRCAIHMQRLFRGSKARKERKKRLAIRVASAVRVQTQWRKRQASCVVTNLRKNFRATRIQCAVRKYFAHERVSAMRIYRARRQAEAHERENMAREDAICRALENEAREQELMLLEDAESHHFRAEQRKQQAEQDGIPLLPWRRRKTHFGDLVVEQQRERRKAKVVAEKLKAAERQAREQQKQASMLRIEKERHLALRKALRKKEKERQALVEAEAREARIQQEQAAEEERNRQRQRDLLKKQVPRQTKSSGAQDMGNASKETRKRLQALIDENEREQKELRAKAKRRMEAFKQRDEERLRKVRQRAARRARASQIEESKRKAEEERKQQEREDIKRERAAKHERERQARLRRVEQKKLHERREQKRLSQQLEQEELERKEESKRKAEKLRKAIARRRSSRRSNGSSLGPNHTSSVVAVTVLPLAPGGTNKTRRINKGLSRAQPKRTRARERDADEVLDILSSAKDVLLPPIDKLRGRNDPLARALEWKMQQQRQEQQEHPAQLSEETSSQRQQQHLAFIRNESNVPASHLVTLKARQRHQRPLQLSLQQHKSKLQNNQITHRERDEKINTSLSNMDADDFAVEASVSIPCSTQGKDNSQTPNPASSLSSSSLSSSRSSSSGSDASGYLNMNPDFERLIQEGTSPVHQRRFSHPQRHLHSSNHKSAHADFLENSGESHGESSYSENDDDDDSEDISRRDYSAPGRNSKSRNSVMTENHSPAMNESDDDDDDERATRASNGAEDDEDDGAYTSYDEDDFDNDDFDDDNYNNDDKGDGDGEENEDAQQSEDSWTSSSHRPSQGKEENEINVDRSASKTLVNSKSNQKLRSNTSLDNSLSETGDYFDPTQSDEFKRNAAARVIQLAFLRYSLAALQFEDDTPRSL